MIKLYYLANHELRRIYKVVIGLCLVLVGLQQVFLMRSMGEYLNRFERFEDLFSKSGCIAVFIVCFAALSGLCVYSIYSDYMESRSIYTLLTLPQRREYMYFARLAAFTVCFLALIAVQAAINCTSYGTFA